MTKERAFICCDLEAGVPLEEMYAANKSEQGCLIARGVSWSCILHLSVVVTFLRSKYPGFCSLLLFSFHEVFKESENGVDLCMYAAAVVCCHIRLRGVSQLRDYVSERVRDVTDAAQLYSQLLVFRI